MHPRRILFILGTRPEAIKLCPLIRCMRAHGGLEARVCVTAQHREMLDQVLSIFGIAADHDLSAMKPGQTLFTSTSTILARLEPVFAAEKPAMAIVQGDTTTTFCGALAAFYANVPVAHVEAGLRTGDSRSPFPEEMNRILVSRIAALHFAATEWAAENLRMEGIRDDVIAVVGNTGIDSLLQVNDMLARSEVPSAHRWSEIAAGRKIIAVTAHRRESFGAGFARICSALKRLAERGDALIVYPVHPNPNVADRARELLAEHTNILLMPPLDYISFVDLMRHSHLLLTDSGGVQEEGPSLGKPVIVLRDNTERPEALRAGTVCLAGNDTEGIVRATTELLNDTTEYQRRSRIHNPYGDGSAAGRITALIANYLDAGGVKGNMSRRCAPMD